VSEDENSIHPLDGGSIKSGVWPILLHQLVMGTEFCYIPTVQHENLVCATCSGESVCNKNNSLLLLPRGRTCDSVDDFEHIGLGMGV
jgi:hypothetical protein